MKDAETVTVTHARLLNAQVHPELSDLGAPLPRAVLSSLVLQVKPRGSPDTRQTLHPTLTPKLSLELQEGTSDRRQRWCVVLGIGLQNGPRLRLLPASSMILAVSGPRGQGSPIASCECHPQV